MSVYKPGNSRFWHYDFILQGRRFHGSTGQPARRAAEAVERTKRLEAGTGTLGAIARLSLNQAAGRWFAEKGINRGDAADVERRVGRLLTLLGPNTRLSDINQAVISAAIERRRRQVMTRSPKEGARQYLPSNATVNRDVIETLRPILRRAKTHWTPLQTAHGLPEIDWAELHLSEPRGLSRLYSPSERLAWLNAAEKVGQDLGGDVRLAVDMLLTYGLRLGELTFPIDRLGLDPAEPTLTQQKGRKRDVILHLPLRLDHARQLAALAGRARAAKPRPLDTIWFARRGKLLVPLTYHQLEYRISLAADRAGITGSRRIHGARHHAGSTILKRTSNLKAVQGLLGHASIQSSQRYAHVLTADLREALEDEVAVALPNEQHEVG